MTSTSGAVPVLDFSPHDADTEVVVRTRRLLSRATASLGSEGLAQTLHVPAASASRLKHRVACVTCRSKLDGLVAWLASEGDAPTDAQTVPPQASRRSGASREGPAPLRSWLVADKSRGLAPAPRALTNLDRLASFLAVFGAGPAAPGEEVIDEGSRRGSRAGGIVRCPYHAPSRTGPGQAASSNSRSAAAAAAERAGNSTGCAPAPWPVSTVERKRLMHLLFEGTSEAEWDSLGSVDIDDCMYDFFCWFNERGYCATCIDVVTGALLELQRQCCEEDSALAQAESMVQRATSLAGASNRLHSGLPEFVRVQDRLRHVCGVYRLEADYFNDRPVYRKQRPDWKPEAYLVYTALGDWMISGQIDAGGAKCEGWAYVNEPAETPDKVCRTWRTSGPGGWEEDPSLSVTAFEDISDEMREGIGYEDGTAVSKYLEFDECGILFVPLCTPQVLDEVLWATDELAADRICTGGVCKHILTANAAQRELYCWLRWLLRERLDKHRQQLLMRAQVGHQLCRLYACAALQQLEQAVEHLPSVRACKRSRAKKAMAAAAAASQPLELKAEDGSAQDEVGSQPELLAESEMGIGLDDAASNASQSTMLASPEGCCTAIEECSDDSASTRASSEEPPDAAHRVLATKTRRLMQEMGWQSLDASEAALDGAEVTAWMESHPEYRQAVWEGRQRLRAQFRAWATATVQ